LETIISTFSHAQQVSHLITHASFVSAQLRTHKHT